MDMESPVDMDEPPGWSSAQLTSSVARAQQADIRCDIIVSCDIRSLTVSGWWAGSCNGPQNTDRRPNASVRRKWSSVTIYRRHEERGGRRVQAGRAQTPIAEQLSLSEKKWSPVDVATGLTASSRRPVRTGGTSRKRPLIRWSAGIECFQPLFPSDVRLADPSLSQEDHV